ncbi:MAG: pyrroloquinoline quinone biosynthesis protein PqqD [Thermoleophilia bacterium]|nr:pyrroloquinoline quinone biosynthesis protein PqqD [Thermoleophilia bacterium]
MSGALPTSEHRPTLASGVRLHHDAIRERHVLLFPEGALVLNETAAAVLALCDGVRTIDDIAAELAPQFGGADVRADVAELVAGIAAEGLMDRDDER